MLEGVRKNDRSFNAAIRAGIFTVPGGGDVDFTEIATFVRVSSYHGWVVVEAEQDPVKAAPRVYAEKAFSYVKNLLFS